MVTWPCILKLGGDNELIYLTSIVDLNAECRDLILTSDDYVIDSVGKSYFISDQLTLTKQNKIFNVEEVTELIRANEFSKAEVCLTKIQFLTVSEAIKAIQP
ncbi:hypothetical protein CWS31_003665 [Colwellia echini]|uniref:Uncharacterized protein n=1 Tax=Colwellia echini TaxID=1982103 RepID=A0ABY3N0F6_9GAMM|nr:hypothetical protein CWS31_003665 [Colwellia echini]